MFGGRQTVAVWGSFTLGCTLVALTQRPGKAPRLAAPLADTSPGVAVPVERTALDLSAPFEQRVIAAASREGLDPALVLAVVEVESRQSATAVSPKGAVGLMQVLPETAAEIGFPDAADPAQNLEAGCRYLSALLETFGGDVELALAAYNAGPGAVRRWGTVPPYRETRTFVVRVGAAYTRLTGLELTAASRFTYQPSAVLGAVAALR